MAYEREVARGDVGVGVDPGAAAEERGLSRDSPHLAALTNYMGVAGWIEADTSARVREGTSRTGSRSGAWRCCAKPSGKPVRAPGKLAAIPNQKHAYLPSATISSDE